MKLEKYTKNIIQTIKKHTEKKNISGENVWIELLVRSMPQAIFFESSYIYNKKNIPEKISDTMVNKNLIFLWLLFTENIYFKIIKKLYFAKYSFYLKIKYLSKS